MSPDFSAENNSEAAKHFFLKTLVTPHTTEPRVINVDKNAARHFLLGAV